MRIKNMKLVGILLSTTLLTSCTTVGPDYEKPEIKTSSDWYSSVKAETIIDQTKPIEVEWWNVFNDKVLNSLIEQAIENNLDIKIAEANIKEARAARKGVKSDYLPDVDYSLSATRKGASENSVMPASKTAYDLYDTGFDASWELDVFGRINRSVEASNARFENMLEKRRDIMLSVMAETARNYTELRGTQRRIAIMKKNIRLQKKTLSIVKQRHKVGAANEFDVAKSSAQLLITQSKLPNLTADFRSSAYSLALLTGKQPQELVKELERVKPIPVASLDVIPVGLRSDILRRRPDVRMAERNLAAQTADIGAVTATLYPSFYLTGNVGLESISFGDLLESASSAWSIGPMLNWPIFRAGEIKAQIKVEEAQAEAAAIEYERAVLTSLKDVETALVRYAEELETSKRLNKAVKANNKAVSLSKQRYQQGEDDILSVVDAERELAAIEDSFVVSETRTITNLINLYKNLGGGWENN